MPLTPAEKMRRYRLTLKENEEMQNKVKEKDRKCKGGDIHTQSTTLNINMMFGGRGFAALMLHVWQNDTFPKFVISNSHPFCFTQQHTTKPQIHHTTKCHKTVKIIVTNH